MFTVDKAREFLRAAGVFYLDEPTEGWDDEELQTLNMNDTWGWALAWGVHVPDEKLPEVAELFWHYGWCGILYWVSEQENQMKSEFHDVNRFIEFVRKEEAIRQEIPESSKRAYSKETYSIGG